MMLLQESREDEEGVSHLGGDEMAAAPMGRDDDGLLCPFGGHGLRRGGGAKGSRGGNGRAPVGSQTGDRRRGAAEAGLDGEDNGSGGLHRFSKQQQQQLVVVLVIYVCISYNEGQAKGTVRLGRNEAECREVMVHMALRFVKAFVLPHDQGRS